MKSWMTPPILLSLALLVFWFVVADLRIWKTTRSRGYLLSAIGELLIALFFWLPYWTDFSEARVPLAFAGAVIWETGSLILVYREGHIRDHVRRGHALIARLLGNVRPLPQARR